MNKKFIIILWYLLVSQIFIQQVYSQFNPFGTPIIKTFKATDYKGSPKNYCSVQDENGILYFGNNGYVLEFDGFSWRKIFIKQHQPIIAMQIDSTGIIYLSTGNEFGCIAPDTVGTMKYISYSDSIKDMIISSNRSGNVLLTDDFVMFQTSNQIFKFSYYLSKNFDYRPIESFKTDEIIIGSFEVNNRIYLQQKKLGIFEYKDNELHALTKSSKFKSRKIIAMLPFRNKQILVCTEKAGLFYYTDGLGWGHFRSESNDYMDEIFLLKAVELKNSYVLSTLNKGTLIIDKKSYKKNKYTRKIKEQYTRHSGLPSEQITSLYNNSQLNENLLWFTTEYGISVTNTNSVIRKLPAAFDVNDIVNDITYFKNRLYVRTIGKIYSLVDSLDAYRFVTIPNVYSNNDWLHFYVQKIEDTSLDENGQSKFKNRRRRKRKNPYLKITKDKNLLIAKRDGIVLYDGNESIKLEIDYYYENNALIENKAYNFKSIKKLHRCNNDSNRIYILFDKSFGIISNQSGKWIFEGKCDTISESLTDIEQDTLGNIWLSTKQNALIKIHYPDSLLSITIESELPKKDSIAYSVFPSQIKFTKYNSNKKSVQLIENPIYNISGKIYFSTFNGLYSFNNTKNELEKDYTFEFNDPISNVLGIKESKSGDCWIWTQNDFELKIHRFYKNKNGDYLPYENMDVIFPELSIQTIYPADNNYVWISSTEGIFSFKIKKDSISNDVIKPIIRKITIGKDSLFFNGKILNDSIIITKPLKKIILNYQQNSLNFEFVSPDYINQNGVKYSFFLQGFDQEWSNWVSENKKSFERLPHGVYTLKIKAKNNFGKVSEITQIKFEILPPWYLAWWAFVIYGFILFALIWIIIKISIYKLQRDKRKLERIVAERTEEILAQTEEISAQRDELEIKNRQISSQNEQIKSSIRYASTIQEAILPVDKKINKDFDSFIMYRPKDIVSGDFYWYAKVKIYQAGKKPIFYHFVSVLDCTGHGVPGAFMSMIGNTLLNEIIHGNGIYETNDIFDRLDKLVQSSLRQDETENKDGMDATICRIQIIDDKFELQYTGAKNSLYFIKHDDDNVTRIKADRRAIGGGTRANSKAIEFSKQIFAFSKNDMIYMLTDGIIDQNNEERKRLGSGKLLDKLKSIHQLKTKDQLWELESMLENWQKNEEQRDDITVLGIRF